MAFGMRGQFLLMPLLVMAMPFGVNTVIFPESIGEDATDNARMLFISYIMALALLPPVFALLENLSKIL